MTSYSNIFEYIWQKGKYQEVQQLIANVAGCWNTYTELNFSSQFFLE